MIITGYDGLWVSANYTACAVAWIVDVKTILYQTDNFGEAWTAFLPGFQGATGSLVGRLMDDADPNLVFDQADAGVPSAIVLTAKDGKTLSFEAYISNIRATSNRYDAQNQTFTADFVSVGEIEEDWTP